MIPNRNSLLESLKHIRHGKRINDGWTEESPRSRRWEDIYRRRWQHDRVVRSTHGVNCTGSCSWKVYVKDGIITSETQQTDYPSTGEDFPDYEPRGCPRGASFSWYTYSPIRVKYPYVRGELFQLWKDERNNGANPVEAWENIQNNPEKRKKYVSVRGKGGFVRASWKEMCEIIASSAIYTIKKYGPDRIAGFSPIPAMSILSYAAGTRFLSLVGGTIISFYDWYADLPPASPQVWGDQTDVPESADWYNTKYFIIWGTNLPQTRTPDAHFMVEARYNGTKVIGVSPDYAEYDKFADMWLPARAGTDGALAMAMTHVILKEFYVDKQVPYFNHYVKKYTDLPFLVQIDEHGDAHRSGKFVRASDIDDKYKLGEWKTVVWNEDKHKLQVPNGSEGHRWDESSNWNLEMKTEDGEEVNPQLSFIDESDETLMVQFPYYAEEEGNVIERGIPVKHIKNKDGKTMKVATIFDLMMAHTGVNRGLPGDYPVDYNDENAAYTPAWQESLTGVNRQHCITVAREFADNAERTNGKSMIALGGGTNHWYHSDQIYRTILNLVMLTGSQGVNGGGWAHYVGQEKVRPQEGWQQVAFAKDWQTAPRFQNGTSYFYFHTDQYRYESLTFKDDTPWGSKYSSMHPGDVNALSVRLGWLPSFPQFTQNSIDIVKDARENGAESKEEIIQEVVKRIKANDLEWAIEDPDNPNNFPRLFFNWRSNLLGSSGKGHEFFVKHLVGGENQVLAEQESSWKPETIKVEGEAPTGKADLLVSVDFRMTSSGLFSDIVLPAATWYEKNDLSSTDMHPFLHPFNAAITPPWEAKSDWNTFKAISKSFSELAEKYLPKTDELMMKPLQHDTKGEIAQPMGLIKDWRKGEVEAIPGKTMPIFDVIERDYPNVFQMMTTIGPNIKKGYGGKGVTIDGEPAYKDLEKVLGISKREGLGKGRPDLNTDKQAVNAVLTMSGASNGQRAISGWKSLEKKTGQHLADIAAAHAEDAYTLRDITIQPRTAISTPVWSGLEKDHRRYSPFTVNVEYNLPWHTLTGRQSFYLDHDMMLDMGEGFPLYLPPLYHGMFLKNEKGVEDKGQSLTVRYLTPHQKWGIHSMYTDTTQMSTLFRGWQTIWMNEKDGASIGLKDNDFVEVYNRNGAIAARVVLTYRLPKGMVYMYHAQDRTLGVPATTVGKEKKRGGTHNSVTRITVKPTHMIGGYSQLSYAFNYYGPTGNQRDTVAVIRKLEEVDWLEN